MITELTNTAELKAGYPERPHMFTWSLFFSINKRWEVIALKQSPWYDLVVDRALKTNYVSALKQLTSHIECRPTTTEDVSFGVVYVPCIYRMPGGVIVGASGLCCCGPAFSVWRQLLPIVCWFYRSVLGLILFQITPFKVCLWTHKNNLKKQQKSSTQVNHHLYACTHQL